MSNNCFDVIIIGGGAAGLCAAINIKMEKPDVSVAILEKLDRVGKKLITTGNGQCNITNKDLNISRYHGQNVKFCEYALKTIDQTRVTKFFEKIGINIVYEASGKAYPSSYQAGSVVDCLRFALEEKGVNLFCGTNVTDIKPMKKGYKLFTKEQSFECKYLIIATGLFSGGERLGSDGSGLEIMKKLGYKTIKTTPSIVQIKTENLVTKKLKGIKVDALTSIMKNNKVLAKDFGEVLFTDYGLSGPAIMQISRPVGQGIKPLVLRLDLMPEYNENEVLEILKNRANDLKSRSCEEFLTGLLNKRLGQVILKECGISLGKKTGDIIGYLSKVAEKIKAFDFAVQETTGFINSQVTAGGLDTSCFDFKTMESKLHKGLFAVGELLDIDGDCGGFNLAWCWASSILAADSIARCLGE